MLHVLIDLQLLDYFRGFESFGTQTGQHRAVDVRREGQHDTAFLNLAVDNHLGGDGGWESDSQGHRRVSVGRRRLAVDDEVDATFFTAPVSPPDADFVTQDDNVAFVGVVSLK